MLDGSVVQLPTYHTRLIGRTNDVRAVSTLLQTPAARMITLVGSSGLGKTRLAIEVARSMAATFADGVVFIDLAPIQDGRFVLSTLAHALGVQERQDEPPLLTLSRSLRGRHLLVLLDNIDYAKGAAADLVALLAAAQQITFLMTSQTPLGVDGETVYVLPPLAVPSNEGTLDTALLQSHSSIELFVERLKHVQPRFKLTSVNASAVIHICQLLDGYPLAIEFVAAHSTTLDPRDLSLLLRNHLGLRSRQTPAQSSQTSILEPVLDWCTNRLPVLPRQLVLRQGVFLGGWTVSAAQAVLAPEYDMESVAAALAVLVQKNLVFLANLPDAQEPRYMVLDAVREYSITRLMRQKRDPALRIRHAAYYLQRAAETEQTVHSSNHSPWMGELNADIHNYRGALLWLLDRTPELGAQLAHLLGASWHRAGHWHEAQHWLEQALQIDALDHPIKAKILHQLEMHCGPGGAHHHLPERGKEAVSAATSVHDVDGVRRAAPIRMD